MNEEIIGNPLLAAHFIAGIGVLLLGIFQLFFMPKGTKDHKKLGWYWSILMAFLAISSLWDLVGDGLLSIPAHVFTVATFTFLPLAIWAARKGKVKLHKFSMVLLFAIVVGASIALISVPGKLLNTWFFGV